MELAPCNAAFAEQLQVVKASQGHNPQPFLISFGDIVLKELAQR
jgi:hypothetical protein